MEVAGGAISRRGVRIIKKRKTKSKNPLPFVDGHLDFAWNALAFDRDQTWPIARLRRREAEVKDADGRGTCAVCLPEIRKAGMVLFVGTLFTRSQPGAPSKSCFRRSDSDSATPAIAHAAAQGQLAYYRLLETQGCLRIITTSEEFAEHTAEARSTKHQAQNFPLGCIILMECADPITDPVQVQAWYDQGVRALSLAHTGQGTYAMGNTGAGPVTPAGVKLLRYMNHLGMALDLSHLSDTSFTQALKIFTGPICASHSNCRTLVPGGRQFSDEQMRAIIQRDGVIGVVLCNPMIVAGLKRESYQRPEVTLEHLADHIDHLCQLAGDTRHVGIGSDLDGGFGHEHTPRGIDTIADVQKLGPVLAQRGYSQTDITAIFSGNWLRFWERVFRCG